MVENDYIVRREALSYAYLQSVVSYVGGGLMLADRNTDRSGHDAVASFKGRYSDNATFYDLTIKIQLKATSSHFTNCADYLSYSIDKEHYEKYRENMTATRDCNLLMLMILPPEKEFNNWLNFSEEELRFRKCMYWVSLRNAPDINNQQSFSVHFPKKNLFTSDSLLNDILKPLSEGKDLTYES